MCWCVFTIAKLTRSWVDGLTFTSETSEMSVEVLDLFL